MGRYVEYYGTGVGDVHHKTNHDEWMRDWMGKWCEEQKKIRYVMGVDPIGDGMGDVTSHTFLHGNGKLVVDLDHLSLYDHSFNFTMTDWVIMPGRIERYLIRHRFRTTWEYQKHM